MAHLYKTEEWQGGSGRWYVNDVQELSSNASKWWMPARMLKMELTDFVLILKNQFKAGELFYDANTDVLVFSFDTQTEARAYKNWINKKARETQFICGKR